MSDNAKARVSRIAKILGDRVPRDEIEEAVTAFDRNARYVERLGRPDHWYRPSTKKDARAARSLALALDRLERKLSPKEEKLRSGGVARVLHRMRAYPEIDDLRKQLRHWRERAEAFSGKPLDKKPADDSNRDTLLPASAPTRQGTSADKYWLRKRAVEIAADLLERHALPLRVTPKTATRKPSPFCDVAALIAGGDVTYECRTFVQARKARTRGSI